MNSILERIQREADKYGFAIKVERLAVQIYRNLRAEGVNVCLLNERYLTAEGRDYQLLKTRKKGCWTVKEF